MILPTSHIQKRSKNLSRAEIASVLVLKKAKVALKDIITLTGISRATVFRVLQASKPDGSPKKNGNKPVGRPRKTTVEMDNFIVSCVEDNRKIVPKQIQKMLFEKFGVKLSLSCIRFRLQINGLNGSICVRKPLLSMVNKIKRLLWAFKHRNWSVAQWMQVLWSDEKKFELFNSKRRQTCRRRKGEPLRDDTIQGTVKHGGGSAMFWGCFGGLQVGDIFQVQGIMKNEDYHSILVRHAIPSGKRLFISAWIFQQDNGPKHTSKMCKSYIEKRLIVGKCFIWSGHLNLQTLVQSSCCGKKLTDRCKQKGPHQQNAWLKQFKGLGVRFLKISLKSFFEECHFCAKLLLMQEVVTLMKNWQLKKSNLCTTRYSCILPLVIFISPISTH